MLQLTQLQSTSRRCKQVWPLSFRLLDLFPEATAIGNIWKNELSLVERERFRVLVFAERQRQRLAFHAPSASDGFAPAVGSHDPILRAPICIKDQVFVFRAPENDGRFAPMTN